MAALEQTENVDVVFEAETGAINRLILDCLETRIQMLGFLSELFLDPERAARLPWRTMDQDYRSAGIEIMKRVNLLDDFANIFCRLANNPQTSLQDWQTLVEVIAARYFWEDLPRAVKWMGIEPQDMNYELIWNCAADSPVAQRIRRAIYAFIQHGIPKLSGELMEVHQKLRWMGAASPQA